MDNIENKVLGRIGSTLPREYKRNLNHEGNYLPSEAEYKSRRRKKEIIMMINGIEVP